MKKIMSGNEAFAYGTYLAGIKVGAGYPGTPSTEVLENYSRYPGAYAEWSPNEKVAMDVGIGAALAGKRALVTMKHVGLNVAADSLFTVSYTGTNGALVIVNADDPSMHSSQNEQDNRHYAKASKVVMLEPADSEEAKRFVKIAVDISEMFDTPVILRSTTRLSHSKCVVELEDEPADVAVEPAAYERNASKYVMVPMNARQRRLVVEERLKKLAEYAETTPINYIEPGSGDIGVIAAGVNYQYAKEVFPEATFLKLGMVYPLPERLIRDLAGRVKQVVVVEELDPFIEEHVRLLGIPVKGREVFPGIAEFSQGRIRKHAAATGLVPKEADTPIFQTSQLPVRPPMLCPGCAHRPVFYALQRLRVAVMGDIGCYTLGAAPPLGSMHSCICMGASIGNVHGVDRAGVKDRTAAVIGDSTFFHSGIAPLINLISNGGNSTVIVVDNRITAMTGHQPHPGTGWTMMGKEVPNVSIDALARAVGFKKVDVINPYDFKLVMDTIREHTSSDEPSLIVSQYPCVLNIKEKKPAPAVDLDACNECGNCLRIACSPMTKVDGGVRIDPALCIGCGFCASVCNQGAIKVPN
ncbi:indolepyruvate ferredoxin oxidoreductase subunit alpha [Pelotomaculum terephthalicicum JT]|uniref:indolepyruvate ferredoxin oxidoreductase subunit alpha n=1 Tax=Pelotomaculum terephthalicicum TaxID=206393 RepID=UPI001F0350D5|nr:indolepyruvate ferredoxin oxidoreductase subunit alpha [Pelotomaculum terephthalicicum]MCG9966526.1 indolepyruvate ferredoxin oxidoreductase subunit alpha [Pelotomaculum terephthalicicum JT]